MATAAVPQWTAVLLCAGLAACAGPDDPRTAMRRGDYAGALAQWRARAETGDPAAHNFLGIHYQLGLGVAADPARAAHLYRQAALAGDADAQRNLGTLYERGLGVPQDRLLAYGWYHQAALAGNRAARHHLLAMTGELTPNQTMLARQRVRAELAGAGARVAIEP